HAAGQTRQPDRRAVSRRHRLHAENERDPGRKRPAERRSVAAQAEDRCTRAASGRARPAPGAGTVMRRGLWSSLILVAAATSLTAQSAASSRPTNDLPNPYRTIEGWAKLPDGRTWGSTGAVDIDRNGTNVWVAERCGANSCAGSPLDPVLEFDGDGNLIAHFGAGLMVAPHGIFVDRDDNIWVTDCACTGGRGGGRRGAPASTPAPSVGHQIFEFSPQGKLLRTLGTPGGAREPGYFFQPNDVLVAPNGDIFVAEGHSSAPGSVARMLKFSRDGTLIKAWGTLGSGPDDFNQ